MDTMHPLFTEGYDAWLAEQDSCPYQEEWKIRLWLNGWTAACRQENGAEEALSRNGEG